MNLYVENIINTTPAYLAEYAIANNAELISIPFDIISDVWTYTEGRGITIAARFDYTSDMDNLALNITSSFKNGADIAHIVINDLSEFVDSFSNIMDTLFFDKKLILELDLDKISDWENTFELLNKINAFGIVIRAYPRPDTKSDRFVGQIYAFCNSNKNWNGRYYFKLPSKDYYENTSRLIEKICPEIKPNITNL